MQKTLLLVAAALIHLGVVKTQVASSISVDFFYDQLGDYGDWVEVGDYNSGNTIGSSPSVDHQPLVADLSVGASVNYKNSKFTDALVYRTKEFVGQIFGSVSVNYAS